MFKDTPAARALVTYLATPEAATIWAKKGGFSSPNKGVPASAYPDAITRATATALAKAKIFRFDMSDLQPAAFGGTAGQGEWQDPAGLPEDPDRRRRHRLEARGGGRRRRTRSSAREQSEHQRGAPVRGGSAGAASPGALARYARRGGVPRCRRRSCSAVWIVYPVVYTMWRSLYDRSGDHFIWFDNYKTLFTTDTTRTAIKNNAIWVAVVPALVTAIGLVFAVLTERIRWAVAFKIAVFMPMAISLFAAGVIWRIMDQQEPSRGARQRRSSASVHDAFVPPGPLSDALPVGHAADRDAGHRASCSRRPCGPGSSRCCR